MSDFVVFFFQAEDGIRDLVRSRGLGDVYKRQEPLLIRGACPHDCPDTCGTLVEVVDGRAVAFYGDPAHPLSLIHI